MPESNRTETYGTEVIVPADFNAIQDKLLMAWELNQEEDGLPANFLGGEFISGEWSLADSASHVLIDYGWEYWKQAGPRDLRYHQVLLFSARTGSTASLPAGSSHTHGSIAGSSIVPLNLRSGASTGSLGQAIQPFAGINFYVYADETYGALYAYNTSGANVYYYHALLVLPDIVENNIGELRLQDLNDRQGRSYARRAEITSDNLNWIQDASVAMQPASGEEEGALATCLGGNHLYGEFSVEAGKNTLDDTYDWRNRYMWFHFATVTNLDELPSGANHNQGNITNSNEELWDTQTGYAGGTPVAANSPAWSPAAGLAFYADNATGDLICENNTGVNPGYIYFNVFFTAPLR